MLKDDFKERLLKGNEEAVSSIRAILNSQVRDGLEIIDSDVLKEVTDDEGADLIVILKEVQKCLNKVQKPLNKNYSILKQDIDNAITIEESQVSITPNPNLDSSTVKVPIQQIINYMRKNEENIINLAARIIEHLKKNELALEDTATPNPQQKIALMKKSLFLISMFLKYENKYPRLRSQIEQIIPARFESPIDMDGLTTLNLKKEEVSALMNLLEINKNSRANPNQIGDVKDTAVLDQLLDEVPAATKIDSMVRGEQTREKIEKQNTVATQTDTTALKTPQTRLDVSQGVMKKVAKSLSTGEEKYKVKIGTQYSSVENKKFKHEFEANGNSRVRYKSGDTISKREKIFELLKGKQALDASQDPAIKELDITALTIGSEVVTENEIKAAIDALPDLKNHYDIIRFQGRVIHSNYAELHTSNAELSAEYNTLRNSGNWRSDDGYNISQSQELIKQFRDQAKKWPIPVLQQALESRNTTENKAEPILLQSEIESSVLRQCLADRGYEYEHSGLDQWVRAIDAVNLAETKGEAHDIAKAIKELNALNDYKYDDNGNSHNTKAIRQQLAQAVYKHVYNELKGAPSRDHTTILTQITKGDDPMLSGIEIQNLNSDLKDLVHQTAIVACQHHKAVVELEKKDITKKLESFKEDGSFADPTKPRFPHSSCKTLNGHKIKPAIKEEVNRALQRQTQEVANTLKESLQDRETALNKMKKRLDEKISTIPPTRPAKKKAARKDSKIDSRIEKINKIRNHLDHLQKPKTNVQNQKTRSIRP